MSVNYEHLRRAIVEAHRVRPLRAVVALSDEPPGFTLTELEAPSVDRLAEAIAALVVDTVGTSAHAVVVIRGPWVSNGVAQCSAAAFAADAWLVVGGGLVR